MQEYKLTDDGKWIENKEFFMFPGYVLDDSGHWVYEQENDIVEDDDSCDDWIDEGR